MLIAEKCANKSSPPPSGVMKPKPFASLNHLTVPVAILLVPLGYKRVSGGLDGSPDDPSGGLEASPTGRRKGGPRGRQTFVFYAHCARSVKRVAAFRAVPLKKLLQSSNIDPKFIRSIVAGNEQPGAA